MPQVPAGNSGEGLEGEIMGPSTFDNCGSLPPHPEKNEPSPTPIGRNQSPLLKHFRETMTQYRRLINKEISDADLSQYLKVYRDGTDAHGYIASGKWDEVSYLVNDIVGLSQRQLIRALTERISFHISLRASRIPG